MHRSSRGRSPDARDSRRRRSPDSHSSRRRSPDSHSSRRRSPDGRGSQRHSEDGHGSRRQSPPQQSARRRSPDRRSGPPAPLTFVAFLIVISFWRRNKSTRHTLSTGAAAASAGHPVRQHRVETDAEDGVERRRAWRDRAGWHARWTASSGNPGSRPSCITSGLGFTKRKRSDLADKYLPGLERMLKEQRASLPEIRKHLLPQSLDEALAPEQLVCRLCDVEASGQKSYFDHISSKQHAKRLRHILSQCLTCGLQFENSTAYEVHLSSRAHQSRLKEEQLKSGFLRDGPRAQQAPPRPPSAVVLPAPVPTGLAPLPPSSSTAALPAPPTVLATDAAAERMLDQELASILPTKEQVEQLQALMGSITAGLKRKFSGKIDIVPLEHFAMGSLLRGECSVRVAAVVLDEHSPPPLVARKARLAFLERELRSSAILHVSMIASESEHSLLVADTKSPAQITLSLLWRGPHLSSKSPERGFATMQDDLRLSLARSLWFTALSAPLPPAGTVLVSTFLLFRQLLATQDRWSSMPQRMLEVVLAKTNPVPTKLSASGLYWAFRRTLVALSSGALLSPNDLVVFPQQQPLDPVDNVTDLLAPLSSSKREALTRLAHEALMNLCFNRCADIFESATLPKRDSPSSSSSPSPKRARSGSSVSSPRNGEFLTP